MESSTKITKTKSSRQYMSLEKRTDMDSLYICNKVYQWSSQEETKTGLSESWNFTKKNKWKSNDLLSCIHKFPICWKNLNYYLVTKSTLFCANISDEVSSLFGHFIQEHITQGKAAISNMVALVGRGWKQHVSQESHQNKTLEIRPILL